MLLQANVSKVRAFPSGSPNLANKSLFEWSIRRWPSISMHIAFLYYFKLGWKTFTGTNDTAYINAEEKNFS